MCGRTSRYLVSLIPLVSIILAACGGTARSAMSVRTFTNPVYRHDFPDPFVLQAGNVYYAYATNNGVANVQEIRSRDLVHWGGARDAFPAPPRWVQSDIWAPDVFKRHDGKYVLYYAARDLQLQTHCLGRAVSNSPAGPFVDRSAKPFFCQPRLGGDIDPSVLAGGNGQLYFYWKNDGNSIGATDYIYGQRLSPDGMKFLGKPVKLVHNDQSWEGAVVEAPTMWKHAGHFYLFVSGNVYSSYDYATGYAACQGPLGPCRDAPNNPILLSKCKAAGPGGQTIITDAKGQTWIIYHAWSAQAVDDSTVGRQLWIDRLDWKNGKPVVHGPTCGKQPDPAT